MAAVDWLGVAFLGGITQNCSGNKIQGREGVLGT
jgi:hypothetical protein